MSFRLSDEVLTLIKDLVINLTDFEEDSDIYLHTYRYVAHQLQSADSLYFATQKDIDKSVNSLSDKLLFHGFLKQANDIKRLSEKFLTKNTSKEELRTKLNVMRFLFLSSRSPTNHLAALTEKDELEDLPEEEDIDWGAYLKEGIERWSPPPYSESEDSYDEDGTELDVNTNHQETNNGISVNLDTPIDSISNKAFGSYEKAHATVINSVQNNWFNKEHICMSPDSKDPEANIALLWEQHLRAVTGGLIDIKKKSVLSEYKIVREVIWQLWHPHNGVAFKYVGDTLKPSDTISISSARPQALQMFLSEFSIYIETLQEFRERFETSSKLEDNSLPETYKSYCYSQKNILQSIYKSLLELEMHIMKQENITTLLYLVNELRNRFKTVMLLKQIHNKLFLGTKILSPLECATGLLTKLHKELIFADNKEEQDLYLCLYLQTLFKYISVIDKWLGRADLEDLRNEFIIYQEVSQDVELKFTVKRLDEKIQKDNLLQIISTKVLQIGKNIHLLRHLGKLHLIQQTSKYESLHEELIEKTLRNISNYFGVQEETVCDETESEEQFKFPAICPDFCKYPIEMDRLDNLIDTSDGILMLAAESLFIHKEEKPRIQETTLYERISNLTKHTYPAEQVIGDVFVKILKERYSECGMMIKSIMVNTYKLQVHFNLMKHVFLFQDDLTSSFYLSIFRKIDDCRQWGNEIWLTSHFQEILMDVYPEQYDKLKVTVRDNSQCFLDPLKACNRLKIQYISEWPVNIIITEENLAMYEDLFSFILQIKWALYTLNHLLFVEIESKKRTGKTNSAIKVLQTQLKVLRFALINIFNGIQHYILGYVFNKCNVQLEKEFEESHDLDTIINSHAHFVNGMYQASMHLRNLNDATFGFKLLLYLVHKLRLMWKNLKEVNHSELKNCKDNFMRCQKYLNDIIYPVDNS